MRRAQYSTTTPVFRTRLRANVIFFLISQMNFMDGKVVSCSKKRKEDSGLPFLPDEIISFILVLLPADILYNMMRYVCRGWYNIIKNPDFIQANILQSSVGLLFYRRDIPYSAVFAEVADCGVQIRKLRSEFPAAVVVSTCDGFVLFWQMMGGFCIENPLTKQRVTLPPLPSSHLKEDLFNAALLYVPSLRRYKVVQACHDVDFFPSLAVLTVGVDKVWRLISLEHVSCGIRIPRVFFPYPLSAGNFVYWACTRDAFVLALDMESEIVSRLPDPRPIDEREERTFAVRGNKLCFVDLVAAFRWKVWVFETESGEWIELLNLDLTGEWYTLSRHVSHIWEEEDYYYPSLWLRNGEVVVFCGTQDCCHESSSNVLIQCESRKSLLI